MNGIYSDNLFGRQEVVIATRPELLAWLDAHAVAPWTPALDWDLCRGLCDGREKRDAVLARTAKAAGVDRDAAIARFRHLTAPIRLRKGVSSRGLDMLLPMLRERAGVMA